MSEHHLEIWIDPPQTGQWCDKCALPSAITANARTVDNEGVGRTGGIVIAFCPDCDGYPDE